MPEIEIRNASHDDCPLILHFVRELAEYEKALDEVITSQGDLETALAQLPYDFAGDVGFADTGIGTGYKIAIFVGFHHRCILCKIPCNCKFPDKVLMNDGGIGGPAVIIARAF